MEPSKLVEVLEGSKAAETRFFFSLPWALAKVLMIFRISLVPMDISLAGLFGSMIESLFFWSAWYTLRDAFKIIVS